MNKFCRFTVVNTNICYSFIIFVTCQRCWSYCVRLVLWGSKLHTLLPDVWQMERMLNLENFLSFLCPPSWFTLSCLALLLRLLQLPAQIPEGWHHLRAILPKHYGGRRGGKKEQKQVSPLNRPLPDLPGAKWLGCPLHKVSMTLNKMIGFVNGITVHGWL